MLLLERATRWGWIVHSGGATVGHARLTVRAAIAATHPELAGLAWATAVAEHFDGAM